MRRCIYCHKNEDEETFFGREHVLPQLMGKFENNPTLIGLVCDNCNSKIFNVLETKFKEDTEEGIYYQMFNFENSPQIRIRGNNTKADFSPGLEDDFFKEIFPFFKRWENDWKIVFLPQIKIKRYGDNGYIILLIEEVKKLNNNKFSKIKNLLRGVQGKDVAIFTGSKSSDDENSLEEAIAIVRKLGIEYREKKRKLVPVDNDGKEKKFGVSMECRVGNDVGRIISKIVFNYFSFCAQKENNVDILFAPEFTKIKSYILGTANFPIKEIIQAVENEPVIFDEKLRGSRFIGHTIVFYEENGYIISKASFLGKRIYKVVLGAIPNDLRKENFGCGHLFDPINRKIFGLTQNQGKWNSGQEPGFGLFNRI